MKISFSKGMELFYSKEVKTVEELAKLACEANISTGVFKDSKRNIASFEYAECIGLDFDNAPGMPQLSLYDASRIFATYKHAILTTRSHNQDKSGVVAERFRVFLFFEYPITKKEDFYSTWYWLRDQYPAIDPACKDPARLWYKHGSIHSIREDGELILPVRYTEPEKPTKEARAALPGERGDLSKDTLKFLEFGVQAGGRNLAVYKVARDFQQALYDHEETEERIISALDRNNVFDGDFDEAEAKLAIRSAFSKDAKHAPRLVEKKARAFHYTSIGELLNQPDVNLEWLVEGIFFKGGISIIAGGPKVGKTTLIRQLEKCVLRGEEFLSRKTVKGSIFHYSFDEKARTAKQHYVQLGLNNQDPLSLHFGTPGNSNHIEELEEDLMKYKPTLVVIDALFDMVDIEDINNYAIVKRALSHFNTIAERTGCHILFIHHQNKPNANYSPSSGASILGSTAIFASVDCALIFEQSMNSDRRTMLVRGRGVKSIPKMHLAFDEKKMIYHIDHSPRDEF